MTGQSVAHCVACPKSLKNYIQCVADSVRRRKITPSRRAGKTVQNGSALRPLGRAVQVDAIELHIAPQRRVDGVSQRISADGVDAVREHDQDLLRLWSAMMRQKVGGEVDGVE
jgi:hypothetical protein